MATAANRAAVPGPDADLAAGAPPFAAAALSRLQDELAGLAELPEPPIRALLFGLARFEQHGRSLASTHEVVSPRWRSTAFFPRLRDNILVLRRARVLLERHAHEGWHLGPAALWLMDSANLLDEQLQTVRQNLPRNFFQLLPRLRDDPLAGLPRIYSVAWAWVAHTDSGLDIELLAAYLRAYQQQRALTLAELWALPSTLRVVLLENLRRLAERSVLQQVARDIAHQWVDLPDDQRQAGDLDSLRLALQRRGVSEAFLLQLQQREDELPSEQSRVLQAWLSLHLIDASAAQARQQAETTEDHQSIRNAITTLRAVDRVNWRQMFQASNVAMLTLARCPVHAAEREDCQDDTLHAVERLARLAACSEARVAETLLALTAVHQTGDDNPAAAPAHWWHGPGQGALRKALGLRPRWWSVDAQQAVRASTAGYLLVLATLVLAGTGWLLQRHAAPAAPPWLLALAALLLLGPISEAVVAVVNRWISESRRPTRLPRLALAAGIPAAHRVLGVMPVMLTQAEDSDALARQLEQHHTANPEAHAQWALLSDWADATSASLPGDAALLQAAADAVAALNARHPVAAGTPPRFLLLHRQRRWSDSEQRFIGWERKRGKLEQLVQAIADPLQQPFIDLGPLSQVAPGVRYILTLDADTDLPPGQLRALVGVAAHPLNQPRYSAAQRRVTAGYGILQPRVVTPLPAAGTATGYHWLFAGQCGIDPYSAASSELYQDVFSEGSFSGKGLLHVQAMHAALHQRLPDGQVLSHDLLEGSLARCAVVSDLSVVEDAPVHADVANARVHRWARGDWQLLPFLLWPRRWPLAAINRWKLADNLRRTLVAPLSLALLLLVLATGVLPLGLALGVVAAAFSAGPLLGAVAGLAPSRDDIALRLFFRHAGADLGRALALAAWQLALLLQQAMLLADAIGRALWRQAVSRRRLLAWTTAAAAQAAARHDLSALLRLHRRVPLAAALLGLALGAAAWFGAPVSAAAWPLLALWAAAPLWIWLASQPALVPEHAEPLNAGDRAWLLGLARDTWRFYEQHVGADDHHLPPDNVQMVTSTQPQTMVAHRTSPTNIGMYLLSAATAQALGFIGRHELVQRLGTTLDTLERLPTHRGHFYNWIDTRTLAVLNPPYVSTVDSGNSSGMLLAVAQACLALADAPADDSLALPEALLLSQQRLAPLRPVLTGAPSLQPLAAASALAAWPADADGLHTLQQQLQAARHALDAFNLHRHGDDDNLPWLLMDHLRTLGSLLQDRVDGTATLAGPLRALGARCRALALAPDYRMLYDADRKLLHIGWRVDSHQLDDSHYDLLASESRLTSLVAIGKGDVPALHWGALGRPFFACGTRVGLKSWSGSMFEYLMPTLLLDEPLGSVLQQSNHSAVAAQQQEAQPHSTAWGISESAIAGQDHTHAYQYGPQGVALLALRRTPADERVIAPYASALALMVAPADALANLRALQAEGARRTLGFVEAIDHTPRRQVDGSSSVLVHSFMAHHQGMSLAAMANVLTAGLLRRWAMADPVLRATAVLLHERAPREVPRLLPPPPLPVARRTRSARLVADVQPLADALPATQLLSNGRHAVVLRSNGAGHSQWDGIGLTRHRDDLLRDDQGHWLYLRRIDPIGKTAGTDMWHSITAHPAPDPSARYSARMQLDRVVFEAQWSDLQACCTVWVSPEDDCELRQVVLVNTGRNDITLELCAVAEPTLAPQRADETHPAFSNLFLQARWVAQEQALYLRRQPRLADEQPMRAVHFLALADGVLGGLAPAGGTVASLVPCVDRAAWLGRYGQPARPLGEGDFTLVPDSDNVPGAAEPGQLLDTGLDPVAALRAQFNVPAGGSRQLTFCSAASRSLDTLTALVDKYRQPGSPVRASSMSHTRAGILQHELQFDTDTWAALLRVNTWLSGLLHRDPPPEPTAASGRGQSTPPRCDRRLLWRHGLSGDRPIILVGIAGENGLPLVLALKKAMRLWTAAGLGVDLVVLNAEPPSYLSPVQHQLVQLRDRLSQRYAHVPAAWRGVLHLLADNALSADERHTLHSLACLRLQADSRSLAQQMDRLGDDLARDQARRLAVPHHVLQPLWPTDRVQQAASAPAHRFSGPASDVVFEVSPRRHPQRPWVNVLANPDFGCQVSEVGSGFTWAGNSRLHQITGWSNDALSDPPAEWLLLHDQDTQRVWPLGQVLRGGAAREVTHGLGFSHSQQRLDGLDIALTWCVDRHSAVKQLQLDLRQGSGRPRRLRLVAVAAWVMGGERSARQTLLAQALPWQPAASGEGLRLPGAQLALQATQLDHFGGMGGATAFLALRPLQPGDADARHTSPLPGSMLSADDWTCDRRELHGAGGQLVLPQRLGRRQGQGLDPCAALGISVVSQPGQAVHLTVLLGHAASPEAAALLLQDAWSVDPAQRLADQRAQWQQMLAPVSVHTPDAAFDALANHWLPYQTVVCRLWARAGFYQAGGAYGFRDQLQDAMAMANRAPALLAAQIRRHAQRQFAAGDVQHWWHMPGGAGVRTHFSDDLLWLPLALTHYLAHTGDAALLDEQLPFLDGSAVPAGQEDVYESPQPSAEQASVYEHAARAIDHSLRVGVHGLPLMGTGDWNDGMNRVGHLGRGESVWLAWFLCHVVDAMLPVASARSDSARVAAWGRARQGWVAALDGPGWDGAWYRRGYFDDGTPLGAAANDECRIDLIAQAWAVLSGAGEPQRALQAMASAQRLLIDADAGIVRLLDPPLQHSVPSAGYIQSYPPGVRENGGQYNHAGVWALMALARLGQADAAWQVFTLLSPAHRWAGADGGAGVLASDVARARGQAYALEPYVMAGDIYSQPPWVGRGGWSWYTGSAGWLARAAVESVCGVVLANGRLTVQPALPSHWAAASVVLRQPDRQVVVRIERDPGLGAAAASPADAPLQRPREMLLQRRVLVAGQAVDWASLPDRTLLVVRQAPPADAPPAATPASPALPDALPQVASTS